MKNVSNGFKEVIENGGPFYGYAEIVFSDGREITLNSEDDFFPDDNKIEESGGGGFPLGVALSRSLTISIDNSDDRFSKYDFYYAKITMYTEADISDGTVERLEEGTFTVTEPVAPGDVIDLTAYDDMYKTNVAYTPKVVFPSTAFLVLQDACSQSEIILGSTSFLNDDFEILSIPDGLTCRQVIGYIAMIAVGNAVMDENNRLIIKSYDFSVIESVPILSGGNFGDDLTDSISGGMFGDGITDSISGGNFRDISNNHILSDFSEDPEISTDDVVITGILISTEENGETKDYLYGEDDYALKITNSLVSGKEETLISLIGDRLIGTIIRPFSGNFFPDPTVQFMDTVYIVDRKENIYQSFITDNTFNYLGDSSYSNSLESPIRNNSTYYSAATESYRKAREQAKNDKTEWEKAMEDLSNRVDNSSGLYMTKEEQEDGSIIYYMHDKPSLEESMIIWKMTAEAFFVSSDGGKTYSAGLTVDGTLIAKILNTVGVNADWINAGSITAKDNEGNIVFYLNVDTGQVILSGNSIRIGDKTLPEVIDESKSISIILDNEYYAIPSDYTGNIESFPDVQTKAQVYFGSTNVSEDCIYNITESESIVGSWSNTTKTYTVTNLLGDSGWVDITATYLESFSATKRFNVQKIKSGEPGKIYTMEPSTNIVINKGNIYTPDVVEFRSYEKEGSKRIDYLGRWKIEETQDGNVWETVYESSEDENFVSRFMYAVLSDAEGNGISTENGDVISFVRNEIVAIRATLYTSGGFSEIIDIQTVTVVADADSLTHEDVFNLLTNNGEIQGIYQEEDQLYINAEYIKTGTMSADRIYGGTLMLGGSNNDNGVMVTQDADGNIKSKISNDGVEFFQSSNQLVGKINPVYFDDIKRGALVISGESEYQGTIVLSTGYENQNDITDADIVLAKDTIGGLYGGINILSNVYVRQVGESKTSPYIFFENGYIKSSNINLSGFNDEFGLTVYDGNNLVLETNRYPYTGNSILDVKMTLDMNNNNILNQSDERVKSNIIPFTENAIEIINDIQVYGYTWIENGKHEKAGFIAQQLNHEVDADFTEISKKGVYSVKPLKIIPYLVKSIQELSEEIESLKKEICNLKGETYVTKETKKDKWKPSEMSLEEKMKFIESLNLARKEE